jgi:methylenetetrahydrofolate--tRNA-(uracil-5-)-methyltransferase
MVISSHRRLGDSTRKERIGIIGAGLAGSEAAWYLAELGYGVVLAEAKRLQKNPSQKMTTFAELVCTNSLKSKDPFSSHGLLKYEMRELGSLVLRAASHAEVPAGDALAVDREQFSDLITQTLKSHPLILVVDEIIADPLAFQAQYQLDFVIVATGPLTHTPLEEWLVQNLGEQGCYFYDAIAPVVDADSLDLNSLYIKDRHKEISEGGDYLNAAMNKEEYYHFVSELAKAEKVPAKEFEDWKFFESCLPIDLMAERGPDTARFSCMKPIGLERPDGTRPFAVVQLRKENLQGSAYNLVGFQTRLTYKEQLRVFRLIPGFSQAQFFHLGSCHRNTFINTREFLNNDFSSQKFPQLYFAGQITGVEGYTESASIGLYVATQISLRLQGLPTLNWPSTTAIGALVNYVRTMQRPAPSNINMGLFPEVILTKEQFRSGDKKKVKKSLIVERAHQDFHQSVKTHLAHVISLPEVEVRP